MDFNNFLSSVVKTDISTLKNNTQPKPFVKWVGGKRSIMRELLLRMPKEINNYYEPFVGGGALFFEIHNMLNHSYLSDLNVDLIVSYNIIKTRLNELTETLKVHQINHSEEYYYSIRGKQDLSDPIENSARFIYLMKTCYNGLYRVNQKNEFNTPIGNYANPTICDEENLKAVAVALKKADIKYQDFTKITPKKGDFVYFDPPYHPTKEDSFIKYVSNGFTEKDQTRLKDFALELSKAGVKVMISNSDAEFIIDIYKKNFKIEKVLAPRVVNCKADKRQSSFETLITNY